MQHANSTSGLCPWDNKVDSVYPAQQPGKSMWGPLLGRRTSRSLKNYRERERWCAMQKARKGVTPLSDSASGYCAEAAQPQHTWTASCRHAGALCPITAVTVVGNKKGTTGSLRAQQSNDGEIQQRGPYGIAVASNRHATDMHASGNTPRRERAQCQCNHPPSPTSLGTALLLQRHPYNTCMHARKKERTI